MCTNEQLKVLKITGKVDMYSRELWSVREKLEERTVFGPRIMNKMSADGRGRWFHL